MRHAGLDEDRLAKHVQRAVLDETPISFDDYFKQQEASQGVSKVLRAWAESGTLSSAAAPEPSRQTDDKLAAKDVSEDSVSGFGERMTSSDDDSDSAGWRVDSESSDDEYVQALLDLTIDRETTASIKFDPDEKPPIRKFDKFYCDNKHLMELRTTGQTPEESRAGTLTIYWWCNDCKVRCGQDDKPFYLCKECTNPAIYCSDCYPKRASINQDIIDELRSKDAEKKVENAKERPRNIELGLQALNQYHEDTTASSWTRIRDEEIDVDRKVYCAPDLNVIGGLQIVRGRKLGAGA